MRLVKGWEQEGVTIQEPYRRTIKTIYSPDEENGSIAELLFTHAIIYPHSQTDYHAHDRPELIYVVYGRQGVAPVGVGLLHRPGQAGRRIGRQQELSLLPTPTPPKT